MGTFKHNGALSDMGGGGLSHIRVSRGEVRTVDVLCWLQGVKRDTEGAKSRRNISVSLTVVSPFDVKLKERSR